jgi:hypothetical protein
MMNNTTPPTSRDRTLHARPGRTRFLSRNVFAQTHAAFVAAVAVTLVALVPAAAAQPTQQQAKAKAKQEPPPAPGSQTFNTVITKLKAGKQVFSNTITEPDLAAAKKA